MYRVHGFQDKDQLLEMLVKENSMTFFPEFNLLAVTSSPALFRGPMSRETAIFNVTASEISSGEFFKGCDYVSDFVFKDGRDKAIAIIDSYEQDSDGFTFHDRRIDMLSRLFSWSSTITASSIPDMVRRASYYQKHLMSNRESFELSHGKPLSEISERPVGADAKGLLDKLTSSETVSYFPEFNLLVTTTEYDPLGLHDCDTCVFNVFPSDLPSGTAPTMSTLAAWPCSCPAATSSARSPSPSFSKRWQIVSASNPRNVPSTPIGRGRRNASARAHRISKSRSIAPTTITSSKER